jgi:GDPmannose 4,6-dehydratase
MMRALVTGIMGQDGAYLAEFLLNKGYDVFGLTHHSRVRLSPGEGLHWLGIADQVRFVEGNLIDLSSLVRAMRTVQPNEVYNLAAQSPVSASWDQPLLTGTITGLGAANVLEAVRLECPQARFYQASSSEMFGQSRAPIQNEQTPFYARSPYGAAKIFAHWMTVNYREAFHLHASTGILFNHESPLRGMEFVTRKITDGVAQIKLGLTDHIVLGNLEARRDWGHARDFVRAMWLMTQQDVPDDYVISTGRTASVREFCEIAFGHVGLSPDAHIRSSESLLRPSEISIGRGDSSKARVKLNWTPTITLEEMAFEMIEADLRRRSAERWQGPPLQPEDPIPLPSQIRRQAYS